MRSTRLFSALAGLMILMLSLAACGAQPAAPAQQPTAAAATAPAAAKP
ncbi:MAG: basic amino acid ABC transporter substrate-binding protein, partial [Chloroflexales bacterium]|nr:basic amino acid ABC transporter substrate-binding protein [Chloroflexales bacterium]